METQFTNSPNGQENDGYISYAVPQPEVSNAPDRANRRYGLGRAIAANVISFVSVMFAVVALFFTVVAITGVDPELDDFGWSMLTIGILFTFVALVTAIISIVLGIKSIICFKKVTPRPIATLILGINATAAAAEGLVVVFMDFIYAFVIFAALLVA